MKNNRIKPTDLPPIVFYSDSIEEIERAKFELERLQAGLFAIDNITVFPIVEYKLIDKKDDEL